MDFLEKVISYELEYFGGKLDGVRGIYGNFIFNVLIRDRS